MANAARARDTSSSDPWITFVDLDRKETLHRLVKEQRRIGAYLVVLIFDDFAVTTRSSAGELSDGDGLEHRSLRAEQRLPAFGFRVILSAFNMPDRVYLHPIDPGLLPGAHNAIHTCLRLKPRERITIITDSVGETSTNAADAWPNAQA